MTHEMNDFAEAEAALVALGESGAEVRRSLIYLGYDGGSRFAVFDYLFCLGMLRNGLDTRVARGVLCYWEPANKGKEVERAMPRAVLEYLEGCP